MMIIGARNEEQLDNSSFSLRSQKQYILSRCNKFVILLEKELGFI